MLQKCDSGNKLAGVYLGTVLQHLTHGYCKILIHGVYPQEWAEQPDYIPKAQQASPLFAGTNNGNGTFSYPNIGSTVWCMFQNGDQNLPIYFAAALGGQNAYGQHDLTLNQLSVEKINEDGETEIVKEYLSDKHIITSGKTHVVWHESGKISAIVEDPIRTDAVVNYISDEVSCRPLQDLVDARQISNINCQTVLDNYYDKGTISSSTYCYRPYSESSSFVISSTLQAIISSYDSEDEISSYKIQNNDGQYLYGNQATHNDSYMLNDNNVNSRYTLIKTIENENQCLNATSDNLSGWIKHGIYNSDQHNEQYNYAQLDESGNPKTILISSMKETDGKILDTVLDNSDNIIQDSAQDINIKRSYNYVDKDQLIAVISSSSDGIFKQNKLDNDNTATVNQNQFYEKYSHNINRVSPPEGIIIHTDQTKKTGQSESFVNSKRNDYAKLQLLSLENFSKNEFLNNGLNILHTLKVKTNSDQKLSVDYKNKFQLQSLSTYSYKDLSIINDQDIYNRTELTHNAQLSAEPGRLQLGSHYKLQKIINGKSTDPLELKNDAGTDFIIASNKNTGFVISSYNNKAKIDFVQNVDTKEGQMTIKISDKESGHSCTFKIGADGQFNINATAGISIKAPKINVSAANLNMTGGNGDCYIKNVSLVQHQHFEMQNGDVVYSGMTKTKSATASN